MSREEMSDLCHKYLCVFCKCFIFGATPARLASNLNDHNYDKHPNESHEWTASGIGYSTHYSGPSTPNVNWTASGDIEVEPARMTSTRGPRKEYTEPHGTDENRYMTPAGRAVLKTLGVIW
jgi:hypothetical protein